MRLTVAALLVLVMAGCASDSEIGAFPMAERVVHALDGGRAFRLRLRAGQRHVACAVRSSGELETLLCGDQPRDAEISRALAELAPGVIDALRRTPDVDALWAAALLDLWSGRKDSRLLDRAISRLSEVQIREPRAVPALNHLAVAYSARASLKGDPRDLYSAVNAIEQAHALNGNDALTSWNRAVLLTLIRMDRQGAEAWATVRAGSDWKSDGVAFADTLARDRVVRGLSGEAFDPQAAREFLFDTLLAAWSEAAPYSSEADSLAVRARDLGSSVVRANGDSSLLHVARDLGAARQAEAMAGVRAWRAGMKLYAVPEWAAAGDSFRVASKTLRSAGAAALADWSDNQIAAVSMNGGDLPPGSARFSAVVESTRRRGDRVLEARARWGRGLASARGRSMTVAETEMLAAESTFLAIGERWYAGTVRITLGEVYGFLGRSNEAANSLFRGISSRSVVRYEDLLSLSQWMSDAFPWAYALAMRELTIVGATSARPKDVPESLARLALALAATGDSASAIATLDSARQRASSVSDPLMRARLDAELDRTDADLRGANDPAFGIARVDAARRYFRDVPLEDAGLLLRRSRLSVARGDSAQARTDLADALDIVHKIGVARGGVTDRPMAATAREANRELIALTLSRGDTAAAWAQTVKLNEPTHPGLMPSVAELRFVVLPERVMTWLGRPGGVQVGSSSIPRQELTALVRRFVNLLRTGDDPAASDSMARRLYSLLLAPLGSAVYSVDQLSVSADGVLHELPVAFLLGESGRLIDRVTVHYIAPEGTRPRVLARNSAGTGRLLVVNPAWSRSDFPGLEPLRSAASETRSVASTRRADVLNGVTATRSAFVAALPRHDVVHFVGHARVVTENPPTSHLVLANSGHTFADGVLLASDIATMPLGGVRLVVLSACGKASSATGVTGEVNGLVTGFLDGGAGSVVSGLWEIDDDITARLMGSVHAHLARGVSPEESLRQAQLALLKEPGADSHTLSVAAAFVVHSRIRH